MAGTLIGIEIGGTKLQVVAGGESGRITGRHRFNVEAAEGAAGIRRNVEWALRDFSRQKISAVGVGFGGPVDWRTGRVACSHQVGGWNDFPMAEWIEGQIHAPVFVDNDANVGALGEASHGAGAGMSPVFYVTLGSGVGGGLVLDGRIYHGAAPGEAEIGHLRLDRTGVLVEERCSGWAVDGQVRAAVARGATSALARHAAGLASGQARAIGPALKENCPVAAAVLAEVAGHLAFALSHVVHLFHPSVVVLGGGLSLLGEPLRAAVEQALPGLIMKVFAPGPAVVLSKLGEDAVPVGALALAAGGNLLERR